MKNSEGHFDYNSLSSTKHCNTHALNAKKYKPQFAHRKVFTDIVQVYLLYIWLSAVLFNKYPQLNQKDAKWTENLIAMFTYHNHQKYNDIHNPYT